MDVIDRSVIPSLHAAARRERSEYVHALLTRLAAGIANALAARAPRIAHWT